MGIAYSQLNPKQKQAANHVHGPMLVLAGAGTGKTSVLVHRISRLISAKHAHPNEIRAFTFTHKAAREDRKSTRLNSSHRCSSYAVFCLKKITVGDGWPNSEPGKTPSAVYRSSMLNLGTGFASLSPTLTTLKTRDFDCPCAGGCSLTTYN